MSDLNLKETGFLNINTVLTQVITNSQLNDENPNKLKPLEQQMRSFLIRVNEYQLNDHVDPQLLKQQAIQFSQQYLCLLSGLSQVYLACLDPEEVRGRFDYGKERRKRTQQQQDVIQLYHFVQKFYIELVKQHPYLPIPDPENMSLYPSKDKVQ
ncbi:hypothetical protein [uncultured Shewanella sp.]|uniref:hypothetical protein n=1 Tax=uncultured Shewanella sp. TaxID=173975 RepID=UPI0026254526|nr:hypothetical protein [uncultured Shewanella sp.]